MSGAKNQFLTTSATARELQCSEAAVRKIADLGRLPVQRTSTGTRFFRRQDVDAYRATHARTFNPEGA